MNRLSLLLLISVITFSGKAQKNAPLVQQIGEKLENCQQLTRYEKVYLITDKECYMPGEIVWFRGFIFDNSSGRLAAGTQKLTVNLYDDGGKLISGEQYVVDDGDMNGDILLPENLTPGRYFIAAFTPEMTRPVAVFPKEIIVRKFYESDVLFSFSEPERIFEAGKGAMVEAMISHHSGRPVDRFLLNYQVRHGNKILTEGKVRSSGGRLLFPVSIPVQTGSIPVELIISHPRGWWTRKLALRTSADEITLTFYVEGQHLIHGLARKTGFYATAWNGVPVGLEAELTSPSGTLLSKVKTVQEGYGIFSYRPTPGQNDKLMITGDYGRGQGFELPVPEGPGIAWAPGRMEGGYVTADLLVNDSTNRKLVITATKGYRLLWAADTEISHSARIKIPAGELEPGIVRLNAFSEDGELQTYSLISIPESRKLNIKIDAITDEPGKVKVTLNTSDENGKPVPAKLALSIADSRWRDEPVIRLKDFILTGGEVMNSPLGIPAQEGQSPVSFTDLVLLNNNPFIPFPETGSSAKDSMAEQPANDNTVTGRVTDKKGHPAPGARITMMNSRNMQMYSVVADNTGNFEFRFPSTVDRNDLTISAVGANGKGNLPVITDGSFSGKAGDYVKTLGYRHRPEPGRENLSGYLSLNPFLISEPPVPAPVATAKKQPREEPYKVLLQSATSLLEVIRVMKPFTIVNNQIVFFGTMNSFVAQSGALIVIDGQKMGTQIDALNTLNPHDIDKINISLDPMDIQRYTGLNNVGIIEIETKRGEPIIADEPVMKQETIATRDGFRIPRDFLTSDALRPGKGHDMRTTLHWNAALQTGPAGTTTFSIPLSDIKSAFIIAAEGISDNGTAGYGAQIFSVK